MDPHSAYWALDLLPIIQHKNLYIQPRRPSDFYASNLNLTPQGLYSFDVVCPNRVIEGCLLGVPGKVNVTNAVGAVGDDVGGGL